MIYTLIGCGGAGKDSILNELLKRTVALKPIVSTTSRPQRTGETDGITYNFVTNKQAKKMIKNEQFIEKRIYNVISESGNSEQWIYGITKGSIDINNDVDYVVIVDFNGLLDLSEYLNSINSKNKLTSIYIDTNKRNRLLRYIKRDNMTDSKIDECIRRFLDDDMNVLPAKDYCDFIVNNDGNIENAIHRILDIMEG